MARAATQPPTIPINVSTATTNLERYELLDRIAVGGMAEVFRARASGAHGFEKTLAIKRILPDLARDPEFEQRFINEAKLAVKLSHANIVQVFDFGRFSGSLFIAMEFVEGLDLAALVKVYRNRDEQLPLASALYIAIEMARGLDFAHQRKVIHRDVSPSNILLSRAGEVKIADFGIAEAVAKRQRESKNSGRIMGKWRYMSPEQTRAEPLTIAADVFGAAAVMYEVLTNQKLFPGDEAEQIIENIHKMEISPPSELRAGLPPRVDEVLSRALSRDRRKRPSAGEILRELLDISYESTIVASALGVSEAVNAVLGEPADESSDGIGLDNLIRAQLLEAEGRAPTVRKTAVGEPTQQSVITRAVDADGITILEVDDTLAAGPVALRGGRRETENPISADDRNDDEDSAASNANVEGAKNPGDETEGPKRALATTMPIAVSPTRRILPWAFAIAAAALLAASGAWWLTRQSDSEIEKLPVVTENDGGLTKSRRANLTIESIPPGAEVLINGGLEPTKTPVTVTLDSGTSLQVEVRLEGYESAFERELTLRPGQDFRIRHSLKRLHATLDVRSRPPGATVTLDGEVLGETPFFSSELSPGTGRTLKLSKAEFRSIEKIVDLSPQRPALIDEKLTSSIVYAKVRITIVESPAGGWADVHHRGRPVGRAPGTVRLPVGKQRIVLKNSGTGASKRVSIDVKPGLTKVHRFSLQ